MRGMVRCCGWLGVLLWGAGAMDAMAISSADLRTGGMGSGAWVPVLGMVASGMVLGLLGVVLNLRRSALMGDVMAHAVLPGAAVGLLLGGERDSLVTVIAAGGMAMVWAWVTPWLGRVVRMRGDAAAGVMLAGALSLGLFLIGRLQVIGGARTAGLDRVFFGQASLLGCGQLMGLVGLAIVVVSGFVVGRRPLMAWCFSEVTGLVAAGRRWGVREMFMSGLAVSVAVSIQAMGAVLVGAMLIVPALCGLLVARGFSGVALFAAVVGGLSGLGGGILSSLGSGVPSGAAAAVCAGALLILSVAVRGRWAR